LAKKNNLTLLKHNMAGFIGKLINIIECIVYYIDNLLNSIDVHFLYCRWYLKFQMWQRLKINFYH